MNSSPGQRTPDKLARSGFEQARKRWGSLIRLAVAAAVFVAPWFYGGGGETASLAFGALGLALASVDLCRQGWRSETRLVPHVLLPFAVVISYALIQLLPGLGPGSGDLFPHATISIYPYAGWLVVYKMLGACAWLYLGANYWGNRQQWGALAGILLAGLLLQAGYAAYQYAAHSPYVFQRPNLFEGGAGFGTFIDRDDLAEYLVCGGCFALGCLWPRARRPEFRLLLALAAMVLGIGLLATLSRGGFLLSVGIVAFLVVRVRRRPREIGSLLAVGVGGAAIIWYYGPVALFRRLAESNWQFELNSGRLAIWTNSWSALRHFLPWGAGFGNFEWAYAPFAHFTGPVGHVNAAHSDWLQLWIEGGVIAGIAVVIALYWLGRVFRRAARTPEITAVGLALVAVSINSFYEFGLQIGGIAVLVALLVGIFSAEVGAARRVRSAHRLGLILGLLVLLPAWAAARTSWATWRANTDTTPAGLAHAVAAEPGSAENWAAWADDAPDAATVASRLRQSLQRNPWNGAVWVRLGESEALLGSAGAARSLECGLRAGPSDYDVHYIAANAYVLLGQPAHALQQWGEAARANPLFTSAVVAAALRFAPARQLQPDLPDNPEVLGAFIRRVRTTDALAAADAMYRLLRLEPRPPEDLARALFDDLVDQQQWQEARGLWTRLADIYHLPPAGDGDFTDPDFRERPFGGGLGWRTLALPPGQTVSYEPHCDGQDFGCDMIQFTGVSNGNLQGPFQVIPAQPGQQLRFLATVRVQGLSTDQGIELQVRDYSRGRLLAESEPARNGNGWRNINVTLRVPVGVTALAVGLERPASQALPDVPVGGSIWLRAFHYSRAFASAQAQPSSHSSGREPRTTIFP